MEQTIWKQTQEVLNDLDFPASKEEIVAHGERRSAPGEVARMLRALPLATYRNISELRSSLPLDPAADDGQRAQDKAGQARSPHSHRTAEHLRVPD